jgi:hypothetical protein
MSYLRFIILVSLLCFGTATADVWKWTDAEGKTHFVATDTPIFTWVDDGKSFYSDTPDHEDAIAVQLVWVSKGTLEDIESADESSDGYAFAGETPEERAKREDEQAHYCKRATEIYDSYKNAPRLYRTDEDGEREYLSKADVRATMSETKAKMKELCK